MNVSKRLTLLLLCLTMIAGAASCGGKGTEASSPQSDESTVSTASSTSDAGVDQYVPDDSSTEESSGGSTANGQTQKPTTRVTKSGTTASRPKQGILDPTIDDKSKVVLPHYNKGANKNLSVVIPWDPQQEWVKGWTAAYEALYGGKVSYTVIDDASLLQRLASMKAAGKAPDCTRLDFSRHWPSAITANLVQDAGGFVNLNDTIWKPVGGAQKLTKYNGKNYYIVTEFNNMSGIIYNKKTMKNNGLTEPLKLYYEGKWNWDTFLKYAQELTQDKNGDGINESLGVYSDYYEGLLLTAGVDYISVDEAGYKINLMDKNLVRAVDFLTSLGVSKYNVAEAIDFSEAQTMMRKGTLGMMISINPALYFPDMADAGTLGYAPVPRDPKADKYYHAFAVGGFCIPKGSANPSAAAEFIAAVRIASDPVSAEVLLNGKIKENPNNWSANRIAFQKENEELLIDMQANLYPVFTGFDRFQPDMYYYSLWGPALFDSKPWSALAAEYTPLIQEAIKKK